MYNVELYIERCLMSCLKQDVPYGDYEIIVVNDGSPDGSLQIAERIAKDYNNITIISQPNGGLSAARNTGLSVAKGEYVWFIDSDDWIKENCLKRVLGQLYKNNLEALAISRAWIRKGNIVYPPIYNHLGVMSGKEALLKRNVIACAPFTIYSREFLNKNNLRFYKGIYHEDNEFTFRSYYYLSNVAFTDDVLYFVYQNPNSITQVFNPKKSYDLIIVANNLLDFMHIVEDDYKIIYYNEIGALLNAALNGLLNADESVINEFNKCMNKNRHLFKYLLKSNILKYKLEGVLFILFSCNTYDIYKLIQRFKISN